MNNPQFKNDVSVPFIIPRELSGEELKRYLLDKVSLIDATKRKVTEQMSRYHDEVLARDRTRDFYSWVKRAKSYKSHLTEERDRLIMMIGEINKKMKANRILKSQKKPSLDLSQSFMMVAERLLDEETFSKIESEAIELLES
jgi:hypothetical protein